MSATRYETPPVGIIDACLASRRPGENVFDTARRILVHEALHRCGGQQRGAARLLGVSTRTFNYKCQDLQLRPVDAEYRRDTEKLRQGVTS